jgi:hypothetical protein
MRGRAWRNASTPLVRDTQLFPKPLAFVFRHRVVGRNPGHGSRATSATRRLSLGLSCSDCLPQRHIPQNRDGLVQLLAIHLIEMGLRELPQAVDRDMAFVFCCMFLAGRDDSIDAMASRLGVRRDYVAGLVRRRGRGVCLRGRLALSYR